MRRQKGFVPVIVLIAVLIIGSISLAVLSQPNLTFLDRAGDAIVSPTPGILFTPSAVPTPVSTPSINVITISSVKPQSTIPPHKSITVGGYAYEDRTDDGVFNSDDPKLPNMQFYLYDSYDNQQISTVFSDSNGNFSITLQVRGNLIIKPSSYNNFIAKTVEKSLSSSASGLEFRFRSASAPVAMQNIGIIEGNIYHDANRNLVRDSGENTTRFYKLYLKDSNGNYFNTVENAQSTDAGGHFKYVNLPVPVTYTLELSNPTGEYDILRPATTITLSVAGFQNTNVEIPVYRY